MIPDVKRYRLRHRARPIDVLVAGEGHPLVLLHGWGLSGRAYHRALVAFAEAGFRVAAPSLAVADGWSVERVAETTAEAMAGVEIAPAPLVGHSFGGVIAAHVALQHPDFVAGIVAVNAPLVSLGSRRLGRIMLPGSHYRIVGHGSAAAALLRSAAAPGGMGSLLRSARWFLGNGQDAPLRTLAGTSIPRAIVWAEGDRLIPAAVGARAAELLGCPMIVVGRDDGWTGPQPPDHDWPFRAPAHFARTIAGVLATFAAGSSDEEAAG